MKTENLAYTKKTVYEKADKSVVDAAFDYAVDYMKYLDLGKTERECVSISIEMAKAKGFRIQPHTTAEPHGDHQISNRKHSGNHRGGHSASLPSMAKAWFIGPLPFPKSSMAASAPEM